MAHRIQRGAVRRARHAAERRVRALRRTTLLLTLALAGAAPAHAQPTAAGRTELLESGTADLPGWWSEPGRPGWASELDLGAGYPWALAGLVSGSWRIVDPGRAPLDRPFPGAMRTPLCWYDSVTVSRGAAAWRGWEAALLEASVDGGPAQAPAGTRPRSRADFQFGSGTSAWENYALSVRHGDSLRWLRAESGTWNRGAVGALEISGRHLYSVDAGVTRGRHRVEGSFGQRGAAGRLAGGEEQSNKGAGGYAAWNYALGARKLGLRLERAYGGNESFGDPLAFSRRDAQETGAAAEIGSDAGPRTWGARAEWRQAHVARSGGAGAFGWGANTLWGSVRAGSPVGDGRLEVGFGMGRHDAVDRIEWAPSIAYLFAARPFAGRLTVERVLTPVWSDLAPGQAPFLQSTWSAGLGLGLAGESSRVELGWTMGTTRDRAVVARRPLEELWLRSGFGDGGDYDFGLLTAAARWRTPQWGAGAEGFALARDLVGAQTKVDPGHGARVWVEAGTRLFQGDLGVRLRAEGFGIGPRASEGLPPRRLDGYLTSGVTLIVTLADVLITVRGTNLEDLPRAETWIDTRTGVEALGPGREVRFTLTWRLYN